MNYHKRSICKECKREWIDPRDSNANGGCFVNSAPVSITGNPLGDNCPTCGSPEVDEVLYKPNFPGLDIPRKGEYIVLPKNKPLATIPGRVGSDDFKIRADRDFNAPEKPEMRGALIELPRPALAQTEIVEEELDALTLLKATQKSDPIVVEEQRSSIYDLTDMD